MNIFANNSEKYKKNIFILGNISVFLFFTLILSINSGASIGIALGFVACILSIPYWEKNKISPQIKFACFLFLFLAFFWSHTFDNILSISFKGDYLLRYILGIFFIIGFANIGIHPRSIVYGIATGAIIAGLISIEQSKTIGRAEGFTNAVRFGNIGMMMFLICLTASFTKFFSKKERMFFIFSGLFGLLASILSLSRGGWIMLPIISMVILIMIGNKKITPPLMLISILLISAFTIIPPVEKRIKSANTEVMGYIYNKDEYLKTSVGARLELWKAAFLMGLEKPLTGWGDKEITNGKIELINKGISDEYIMTFSHAHNDFLETWARRGVIGVIGLIIIYAMPIYLLKLARSFTTTKISDCLLITGVIIYLGYFISGLTSVFFTFVISHNFYLFSFIYLISAMQWIKINTIENNP